MKPPAWVRRNLAAQLAVVFGAITLTSVALLGVTVDAVAGRYWRSQAEAEIEALAEFYAAYTAATVPSEATLASFAPEIVSFFAPQAGYDVRLFSVRTGRLLAATRDLGPLPSGAALAALPYRRPTLFLAASHDTPGRLYAVRTIAAADGTDMAVVEVSRDLSDVSSFLSGLRSILLGAGALAVGLAIAASVVVARRMTRPLRQIDAATRSIAAGALDQRVPVTTENEIGRLAESVNCMAVELGRLEASRRDFIARISHDLRTPLTAIKGLVVNLQDLAPAELQASLATIEEQADRLARLVEDLLTLSRLQRGALPIQRTRIDLAEVVRAAARLAEGKAGRMGVSLELDLAVGPTVVSGDRDRLQQVVVNLIDNALRVTPGGGVVKVAIAIGKDGITVAVLDTGRGLTESEVARAFETYYRGPGGGAGLGLSIAREIVLAHGGEIWLRNRPEGGAEAGFGVPRAVTLR